MAGHGQAWGCEEGRSLIEIWWLAMRLRRLQCINTLFSSLICASFSKLYIAWSGLYKLYSKGWPVKSISSVLSAACLCLLPEAPVEAARSFWPIEKHFRLMRSKTYLANKWSHVVTWMHFGLFQLVQTRANRVVQCIIFCLWTKASELWDFPDVNTPLDSV